jgi:RNA polymerase sigma factor (sigma-70 family)
MKPVQSSTLLFTIRSRPPCQSRFPIRAALAVEKWSKARSADGGKYHPLIVPLEGIRRWIGRLAWRSCLLIPNSLNGPAFAILIRRVERRFSPGTLAAWFSRSSREDIFETILRLGTLLGMNNTAQSTPSSERRLFDEFVAGNPRAFADLYRTHIKAVSWYAFHMLEAASDAEDIAHDVFVLAWDKKATIQLADRSLLPWLLVTTRNLCLNRIKKATREKRALFRQTDDRDTDLSLSPEHHAEKAELAAAITEAVEELSTADQTLYYLCIDEGLSYSAAATAMGTTHSTVRNQLSRLRRNLRVSLADQKANFS